MSHPKLQTIPSMGPRKDSGKNLKIFMKHVENKRDLKFSDYWEFHKWSTDCIDAFWADIWDFVGIIYSKPYDKVLDLSIPMQDFPPWFEGARLNIAENYLKYKDDHVALILAGEDRDVEKLTYRQLYEETKIYSAALRKFGLRKGDVVTCYMSNRKEAVIAMLATCSIGAIWTGVSPILGPEAYINRVKQLLPKVLFTVDRFSCDKEVVHLLENTKEIVDGLPSLEVIIIVPSTSESKQRDISNMRNGYFLDDFLQTGYNADGSVPDVIFEQVPFSHPVFINFTSGTTGLPKCVVHGFGVLLSGVRDLYLHCNTGRNDTFFNLCPVGWINWNLYMNHLFIGSTIVLFEGFPYFINPTYFWDMMDELKVTSWFVAPARLDRMEKKGYVPTKKHHLSSLRLMTVGSTVVTPNTIDFVNNKIKKDVLEIVCGCTELGSDYIVSEQTIPYYKGEISSPTLGTALEILSQAGKPVMGEIGELVLVKPTPSLPVCLWGDTDGKTYKNTYFSHYPDKFSLGDLAILNPTTKGIIVCGRSDEALNPSTVCFGSSEIYNIVDKFPEILDSLCVAQLSNHGLKQRFILFITMRKGQTCNNSLVTKVQQTIIKELSDDHVPAVVMEAPDIPYNLNGKKMEIIVKKIINKMPHNVETVSNKECLQFYYDIPELQGY